MRRSSRLTSELQFFIMRSIIFILAGLTFFPGAWGAVEELDERLKAVMLLFDKKQSELSARIDQLEIENESLKSELDQLQALNKSLQAENLSLRTQLGLSADKEIETAASPRNLERLQVYPGESKAKAADDSRPNVNMATREELDELPGVGPVIAQRIIDNRPYATVDDLLKVRGIGKTSIEVLRPLVRVE